MDTMYEIYKYTKGKEAYTCIRFEILKVKNLYHVRNNNGVLLRICKTLKEAKTRIDNQTI